MLRRFLSLAGKDLRVLTRNHYLTVVVVVALLYVGIINFILPANLTTSPDVILWDASEGQALLRLYSTAAEGGTASGKVMPVDSEAAFIAALDAGGNRLGIKAEGGAFPERIVVTYQGHETSRTRRLLEATLQAQVTALRTQTAPVFETERLRATTPAERPPFGKSLLPVFVFSEAAMIGLLLAAALLYSEKEEGTLSAYRVTPGRVLEYLMAKSVSMGLLGVVFTVIVTALVVGLDVRWPVVLGVVFLAAVVVTLLALAVASLFRNINQFLLTGVALNFILALPTVSYFAPSLSPLGFRLLPTYPLIFALREAYFPTGSGVALASAIWQTVISLLVVLPLAVLIFKWQLVRRDAQ